MNLSDSRREGQTVEDNRYDNSGKHTSRTAGIPCWFMPQPIYYPPIFPWKCIMTDEPTKPTPQPVEQPVVVKEKKGWGLGTKILL